VYPHKPTPALLWQDEEFLFSVPTVLPSLHLPLPEKGAQEAVVERLIIIIVSTSMAFSPRQAQF